MTNVDHSEEDRATQKTANALLHEIRSLRSAGEFDKARNRLDIARRNFPKNKDFFFLKFEICLQQKDRALAVEALEDLARTFELTPYFLFAQAKLAQFDGLEETAHSTLVHAVNAFPDYVPAVVELANRELARNCADKALKLTEKLLDRNSKITAWKILRARCLIALQRFEDAKEQLDLLVSEQEATPPVFLMLCYISGQLLADPSAEAQYLEAGLTKFPSDPALVERLIRKATATQPLLEVDRLMQSLGARLPKTRREHVQIDLLLGAYRFEEAMEVLKNTFSGARDAKEAHQLGQALVGLNRHTSSLRYLEFCLRKWPEDTQLAVLACRAFAKVSQGGKAIELIERKTTPHVQNDGMIQQLLCTLHCQVGEPEKALACFRKAHKLGKTNINGYGVLLRCLSSYGMYDDLSELIELYRGETSNRSNRFYSTLSGQLTTEMLLEMKDPDFKERKAVAQSDLMGLAKQVQKHPHSNFAGMRLMQAWRDHPDARQISEKSATIPRSIFQYWNSKDPPKEISEMIDTWRDVPGFSHQLFNQATAAAELREYHSRDFVSAFRLARNPAEQSDFFRLCFLLRNGGLYVDSDDVRIGPLKLLDDIPSGLIIYVEKEGYTFGNNMIAARPDHPAIALAVKTVKNALLMRDNESTWSKSGPGLLTRSIASYVANCIVNGTQPEMHIVEAGDLVDQIAMHSPARHKKTDAYWNAQGRPGEENPLKDLLDRYTAVPAE